MNESLDKIIKTIKEQAQSLAPQLGVPAPAPTPNQATVVLFDKGQEGEFKVKFSERGFLINGTRLSFESLEDAISKNYSIHLDGGQGIALDAVRMQKILKYKGRI